MVNFSFETHSFTNRSCNRYISTKFFCVKFYIGDLDFVTWKSSMYPGWSFVISLYHKSSMILVKLTFLVRAHATFCPTPVNNLKENVIQNLNYFYHCPTWTPLHVKTCTSSKWDQDNFCCCREISTEYLPSKIINIFESQT